MWLIVTVLGAAAVVASPSCPLGWTMYGHSTCMKMFGDQKTWSQSRYTCRAYGAELVTLETKQKIYFVKGWMFDQGMYLQLAFKVDDYSVKSQLLHVFNAGVDHQVFM